MDRMPFWEVEDLLDSLKALAEKEEEERKNSERGNKTPALDMNSAMRQMKSSAPKLPNFNLNNFKL